MSGHLGAAGYIISRKAAIAMLETTAGMNRALDDYLFSDDFGERLRYATYQLVPAICIQTNVFDASLSVGELQSSLVPHREIARPPAKYRGLRKILRELARPFEQVGGELRRLATGKRFQMRRVFVPFA